MNRMEAIQAGLSYIENQCQTGNYTCLVGPTRDLKRSTQAPSEVGTALLLLGTALKYDHSSVAVQTVNHSLSFLESDRFHFFQDKYLLPADVDTTSYGLSVLLARKAIDHSTAQVAADNIIRNTNPDGIVKVYFESNKQDNPIDHVAATNVLHFINQLGRGEEIQPTEEWVGEILNSGAFLNGSRYYHSPDAFLYFLSRSLNYPRLYERFASKLRRYLDERTGSTEFPLDLAMRISSYNALGKRSPEEKRLINQQENGSWPADAIYRYGSKTGYFGSKLISTAFAVEALNRPMSELEITWDIQKTMWKRDPEAKAMVIGMYIAMGISLPLLAAKLVSDSIDELISSVRDRIIHKGS